MPIPSESIVEAQPLDEHNRLLVNNVHPPDWVDPEPQGRYHMVVIGGGTAGLVTAVGAAGLGARVALVERNLMGGDCLNSGCVPSKALIRAAHAAASVRDAGQFGMRVSPADVEFDFSAAMERMRRLRAGISVHDSAARLKGLGVDVFLGQAEFCGPRQVRVGEKQLDFSKACVATGTRAAIPPIPGLREAKPLTNETVFTLTELPRRLAVIGAGPIGVEMAQSFTRFGSDVTLIESAEGVLIREDRDAGGIVQQALERDGVEVALSTKVIGVTADGAETVIAAESSSGELEAFRVDRVLVAAGRIPNVRGLGLEDAGIRFDERLGVAVDDRLRTSNRHVYAAGDVCSAYKFTHTADAMARIVIRNALFFGKAKFSSLDIPWCTYSDPELAHVGLTERDANEKGIDIDTYRTEMSAVDRAVLEGETEGFVKIHCKRGTDRILGATVVARHAGEMISEVTCAMAAGAGLGTIANTIHPYPTQAEAIRKTADSYMRTRLTPRARRVLRGILRLHG